MGTSDEGVLPPLQKLLAAMAPGTWYGLTGLAEMTGMKTTHVQVLLNRATAARVLQHARKGSRNIYLRADAAGPVEVIPAAPRAELKGYDTQWKQFRALCETVRPGAHATPAIHAPADAMEKPVRARRKRRSMAGQGNGKN